jgi:hypothetical protein
MASSALLSKTKGFLEDYRSDNQESNNAFVGRNSSGDSKGESSGMPMNFSTQLRKHSDKLTRKQSAIYYPASGRDAKFASI